jgi:hypothetical protein
VSQRQYDDAVELARYNQTSLHEKEKYAAELQAENERLKRQLAQNDGTLGGLQRRPRLAVSELQEQGRHPGHEPGDIERSTSKADTSSWCRTRSCSNGPDALTAEGREALIKISGDINAKPHGRISGTRHRQRSQGKACDEGEVPARQPRALHARGDRRRRFHNFRQGERARRGRRGFGQYDPLKTTATLRTSAPTVAWRSSSPMRTAEGRDRDWLRARRPEAGPKK